MGSADINGVTIHFSDQELTSLTDLMPIKHWPSLTVVLGKTASENTHITSKEVVFQFESGWVKKIPLPANEMMVAVTPFINNTHK